MRRLLLGVSLVCFAIGTVCFGVFFAQVAWFIIQMPSVDVEQGLRRVAPIQSWGWWFFGLYVTGLVTLLFLPGRAKLTGAGFDRAREQTQESEGRDAVVQEPNR